MTTTQAQPTAAGRWQQVRTGDDGVAVAERTALGTAARVAAWPPEHLGRALVAVDRVLSALDRQASRFRADSELSFVNRTDGGLFLLSDGLAQAIGVALAAARWTGGLADPFDRLGTELDRGRRSIAGMLPFAPETALAVAGIVAFCAGVALILLGIVRSVVVRIIAGS